MSKLEIGEKIHKQLNEDRLDIDGVKSFGHRFRERLKLLHGERTKLEAKYQTNPKLFKNILNDINELETNGYVIMKNLLTSKQVSEIRDVSSKFLNISPMGRNDFEGEKTQRLYGLVGKSRVYDKLLLHPRIEGILDSLLLPNHLLTAFQIINITPNETPQPLHTDDYFVDFDRPRKPTSIAFIWAINDFTKENGATMVIPKSHLWDDRGPNAEDVKTIVHAEMPAGSCLCILGTTWHGGGKNITNGSRFAISNQHCEPYIRPQENQFLSVPMDIVPTLDERIQKMLGYSIHYPFIGHSNGRHPTKAIDSLIKHYQNLPQKSKL